MDFVKVFENVRVAQNSMQFELDMMRGGALIDEVSILWPTQKEHEDFALWMARHHHERYLTDTQTMYALETTPGGDVKHYRYHVIFDFFRMPGKDTRDRGYRLQSQVHLGVNPLRTITDPLFVGAAPGQVVHGSYKTDDLYEEFKLIVNDDEYVLDVFVSGHGRSAYVGRLGDFPYLHPRQPNA